MPVRPKTVHRLQDLLVEEVSIVDKPANRRRFLAIKNEGVGSEVVEDDAGNMVADADAKTVDESAAPSTADLFKSIGGELERIEKLSLSNSQRQLGLEGIDKALERLYRAASQIDMSRLDDLPEASGLSKLIGNELAEVGKSILAMAGTFSSDPVVSDDEEEAVKVLTSLVEGIEKRSPRMGKKRFTQVKEALGVLSQIIGELESMGAPGAPAEPEEEPAKKKPAKKTPAKKADTAENDLILKSVDALSKIVASQKKQLRTLKNVRGQSNVICVDKNVEPSPPEKVFWPQDMNNDRSPDEIPEKIRF
jgi:hypothetical protein